MSSGPASPPASDVAIFQAAAYEDVGRADRAIELLGTALAAEPDSVDLLLALADTLFRAERLDESREAALAALTLDPDAPGAIYRMGHLAVRDDDHEGALAIATRYLNLAPWDADAHLLLAWALTTNPEARTLAGGDVGRTERRRELRARVRAASARALEIEQTTVSFLNVARIEDHLGNAEAVQAFVAAGLALDPQDVDLLAMRALSEPTPAEQAAALHRLVAASPTDVTLLSTLAGALNRGDNDAEARDIALSVLDREPDHVEATSVAAWASLGLTDPVGGLRYARALVALAPAWSNSHMALAWAWAIQPEAAARVLVRPARRAIRRDQRARARHAYRRALDLCGGTWEYTSAAQIEWHLGDRTAMRRLATAGLAVDPHDIELKGLSQLYGPHI